MKTATIQDAPQAFRPLKKKLLFAILIVSTVLTSIVVFFHFKYEYSKDLSSLDEKIQQINDSAVPAMGRAAWNEDRAYLKVQAESIAKLQDVERVRVFDSTGLLLMESFHNKNEFNEKSENSRIYKYPINYKTAEASRPELLGNIEITATLDNINMDISKRLAFFVLAQFLKTFLISWLILIICHHYISKNIEEVIEFVQAFNLNSVDETYLHINRKTKTRDEISLLQDSINRMIKKIHFLNREKENKISAQEIELKQQTAVVKSTSKMAALNEITGGIANEINNPLSVIQKKSRVIEEMIEHGAPDNQLLLTNAKSIQGTADRLSNVMRGLKNISQDASAEERQDAVLKGILENILGLCEEKLNNHKVDFIFDNKTPIYETHINCFPIQLSQVFLILINNAIDALEDLPQKWIKLETAQNKKWMFMHFIDSGEGIPKALREKIFQPFYTTKELGKGTGLGLSLAFEIINKHGGEIFYDEHYKNTCFTIKLPLKERKSILVVDDDIDIREAICSYLQLEGYKTIEANSGKEALKIIRDQEIEFVVSDIRMPDGGGLFLVDELRKVDRLLPYVILVTGQADISREEAIKRGALDLLKKPLEMDRIIGLIKFIENSYNEFVEM